MAPPSKKEDLELPRLLADLRRRAGLKQEGLAKKVGIHGDTLARYERGVRRLPPDLLDKLITALKLDNDQDGLLRSAWEHDEPYWSRWSREELEESAASTTSVPTTPDTDATVAPASESVPVPNRRDLQLPPLLTQLRTRAGIGWVHVEDEVGVNARMLIRYERGMMRVPPDILEKLIDSTVLGAQEDAARRARCVGIRRALVGEDGSGPRR